VALMCTTPHQGRFWSFHALFIARPNASHSQ
jgi:hypothetical protein